MYLLLSHKYLLLSHMYLLLSHMYLLLSHMYLLLSHKSLFIIITQVSIYHYHTSVQQVTGLVLVTFIKTTDSVLTVHKSISYLNRV